MTNKATKFSLEDMLKEVNLTTKTAAEETGAEKKKEKKEEKKDDMKKEKEEGTVTEEKGEKAKEEKAAADTSKNSPITDAMKVAEKLAELDKEAALKEAELIGRAIMDGAFSRACELEKAASQVTDETAAQEKVAHLYNTDEEFRTSFDKGYMDKLAEEIKKDPKAAKAFKEGYEKQASELVKIGQNLQDRGYVETSKVVQTFIAKNTK